MSITLTGSSGITGMPAIYENATISATAATGTINYDILTQTVLYYTSSAAGTWGINVRGSTGVTLDSTMAVNKALSIVFMVTQGTTAYYPTTFTIDGVTITPKWQGGVAPTYGNPNGVDVYNYSIVKTGSAAYTVYAAQSRYA